MYQAFEATIDALVNIRLKESLQLPEARRALVIVLDDSTKPGADETALLSEESLAEESWNRPEEDAAWAYWQSETS